MYTYEERLRAVMLYIKYDLRVTVTIRELGYPSERMLRNWYCEYMKLGDLHKDHRKRPEKYSKEKRQHAVDYYFNHGKCLANTINKLGYPHVDTLKLWIDEFHPRHKKKVIHIGKAIHTSEEKKRSAVIDLCSREGSADVIANKIGVSRQQLYIWKNKLLGKEAPLNMKSHEENSGHDNREELKEELDTLKKDIHKLQLEHDILQKANEILKKDKGINPQNLTNREKTDLIDALKETYKLSELLFQLQIPRSSFFYQRKRLNAPEKYKQLRIMIKDIFKANKKCYGYRRIHICLKRVGTNISEKVIRRIMDEEGLVACKRKQRRYNSYEGEITPAVENVINRDFHADKPNKKWLTDITEFQLPAGKAYLSPIIDCFDGMVVSWTIGTSPDANLVNTMLDTAISGLNNDECPIVHTDRGCHYRWPGWISRMNCAGLIRSMSKKGCSPDNAACEGFFGRLKNEMYYNQNWIITDISEFIDHLDKYIRWYNEKRIKNNLGGLSPVEYRQKLLYF